MDASASVGTSSGSDATAFGARVYSAWKKPNASTSMETVTPPNPTESSGLRPRRSMSAMASTVKTRLVRPTRIACANAASLAMPDCSKIIGA